MRPEQIFLPSAQSHFAQLTYDANTSFPSRNLFVPIPRALFRRRVWINIRTGTANTGAYYNLIFSTAGIETLRIPMAFSDGAPLLEWTSFMGVSSFGLSGNSGEASDTIQFTYDFTNTACLYPHTFCVAADEARLELNQVKGTASNSFLNLYILSDNPPRMRKNMQNVPLTYLK